MDKGEIVTTISVMFIIELDVMLMVNVATLLMIVTQIECIEIVGTIVHLDATVLVETNLTVMITKKITVIIIAINLVQSD